MTEDELIKQWNLERPMYEAWGRFVVQNISKSVNDLVAPISGDVFLRIPPKTRLKEDVSLVEKAFYRGKNYKDPYAQITDKVGARFVVLLARDLRIVEDAVQNSTHWNFSKDRDFEEEQKKAPIQFDYAAVHYVVNAINEVEHDGQKIAVGTPCEIQIKTILQHAYGELTHDTIYKPNVDATPFMHRAAAKSMALLEATNDYFETVVDQVNEYVKPEREVTQKLIKIYKKFTGVAPRPTKLEGVILEAISEDTAELGGRLENLLCEFLYKHDYLSETINEHSKAKLLFAQPSILLVYFLVKQKPSEIKKCWPLTEDELRPLFTDLGNSFEHY